MAVVGTISQTAVPIGPGSAGPFNVNDAVTQYVITLSMAAWPFAGDKAFDLFADVSFDGGVSWQTTSSTDAWDIATPAHGSLPANTCKFACPILPGTGRKIRGRWDFKKVLTVSGTIEAN